MARYERDFMGISANFEQARGMDPNFRGGAYGGMRTRGAPTQASYGRYRQAHADEMEGQGGPWGYSGRRGYGGDYQGYRQPPTGWRYDDRYRGGGGVHDVRYDREFLRDFNTESPAFRGEGHARASYERDYRERGGHPVNRDSRPATRYANRGLSTSGYSEAWARWPMRGGR